MEDTSYRHFKSLTGSQGGPSRTTHLVPAGFIRLRSLCRKTNRRNSQLIRVDVRLVSTGQNIGSTTAQQYPVGLQPEPLISSMGRDVTPPRKIVKNNRTVASPGGQ